MSNIYKGEFQDHEGNVVYPHTTADVVFCTDGRTAQARLNELGEGLDGVTGRTDSPEVSDSNILATSKAVHAVKEQMPNTLNFESELIGQTNMPKYNHGQKDVTLSKNLSDYKWIFVKSASMSAICPVELFKKIDGFGNSGNATDGSTYEAFNLSYVSDTSINLKARIPADNTIYIYGIKSDLA